MVYIGIDIGKKGGIALIDEERKLVKSFRFIRNPLPDILDSIQNDIAGGYACYIERVSATPQMGVCSAFSFGFASGIVVGALSVSGIVYNYVAPAVWKRKLDLIKTDKKAAQTFAEKIVGESVHLDVADAVCIAYYGYLMERSGHYENNK